jgi:hypothetical protein
MQKYFGRNPFPKNHQKEAKRFLIEKIVAANCKIVLTLRSYCRNILC